MRIAERVWAAWREEIALGDEPVLRLLLAPVGDHGDAARALRESVLEVHDAYRAETELAHETDPPWPGEWELVRVPTGVLVQIVECEALESVLPTIAAALERRGIDGALDLPDEAPVAMRPRTAHMIECRARIRGARLRREPRDYLWQADPQALAEILAAAERWCRLGSAQPSC